MVIVAFVPWESSISRVVAMVMMPLLDVRVHSTLAIDYGLLRMVGNSDFFRIQ